MLKINISIIVLISSINFSVGQDLNWEWQNNERRLYQSIGNKKACDLSLSILYPKSLNMKESHRKHIVQTFTGKIEGGTFTMVIQVNPAKPELNYNPLNNQNEPNEYYDVKERLIVRGQDTLNKNISSWWVKYSTYAKSNDFIYQYSKTYKLYVIDRVLFMVFSVGSNNRSNTELLYENYAPLFSNIANTLEL